MSDKYPKARICESVGYTQVRFYPECTACGWYPFHEKAHIDAARVAGEHNAKHHPDEKGALESYRVDVHTKTGPKKKKRPAA